MRNLKTKLAVSFFMLMGALTTQAQEKASPAATVQGKANGGKTAITVNYSSPAAKGREIWGALVPYGKVWRAGANEATTFETDQELTIEGQKLPAGKYALFIIPNKNEATIIFNKVWKQWGAYDYDQSADALRVNVKPVVAKQRSERLVYEFSADGLQLAWDNLILPIKIK